MEFTQGVRFDSLSLSEEMLRALEKRGYIVSTPVQAGCIPPMLDWRDVTAKAPTGTGKTFAFGIPIIEHIRTDCADVQAVILAPTRELAMQITAEMREIALYKEGIRMVCLYGGQPIGRQIDALKKKPQIVVATPGRLSDHMKRRTVRVDRVETVVLDEADRMLDMGFIHDVTRLLDQMKKRKNLGLFSATISREVMDIAWVYQRDAEEITVQASEENKPDIQQYSIEVPQSGKIEAVEKILAYGGYDRVMIFCNTKGNAERAAYLLQLHGVDAQCIHGDIVDAVINFDVPEENEYYVHRIGRTGRARRRGVAYTLLTDYPSMLRLRDVAKFTKNTVTPLYVGADGALTEEPPKK